VRICPNATRQGGQYILVTLQFRSPKEGVIEYQKLGSGMCKSIVRKEGRAAVEKSASLAGAMASDKFAT
jgi:hypothetical protein